MVKTLKITSIVLAALAAGLVILPVMFGVRKDPDIEQFLDTAGFVERFKNAKGGTGSQGKTGVSPLVEEAKKFALYLNPPPPPKPVKPPKSKGTAKAPPKRSRPQPTVSSKFKLIGTCFYVDHPERSLALLDQSGKGLAWVRQGGKVGHAVVEEIKDGAVVVKDGKGTSELVAERKKRTSLLKSVKDANGPARPVAPVDADLQAMGQFLSEIKKTHSEAQERGEVDPELEAFIAALEGDLVTEEEGEKLDELGKLLERERPEPNRPKSRKVEGRTRRPPRKRRR